MRFWRQSKRFGGYWGWFYSRSNRLMIAINEGGNDFAFNLQLWYGVIPCGYYAAVRVWGDKWLRSYRNLKI